MPIAVVTHLLWTSNSSVVTSSALDTTGANLLIFTASQEPATIGNVSDSKGNTWTALPTRTSSTISTKIFYCTNPAVGPGHTFTPGSGMSLGVYGIIAVSGAAASPFHSENGNVVAGGPFDLFSTLTAGSVSPPVDGCLIVSSLVTHNRTNHALTDGFTVSETNFFGVGGAYGYLIQSTAATINPTWSWAGTTQRAASSIAVFTPAADAGSAVPLLLTMQQYSLSGGCL